MSERIHNGDFSGTPAFTWWLNGVAGGEPYILDSAKARADSDDESTSSLTYKMYQPFDVNDEVVVAIITVWGQWETYAGIEGGNVQFLIKLQKPDTSFVTLKDQSYSNGQTGSGNLLDGVDIKSNFDQYGGYKLWLECIAKSAENMPYPDMCSGWYDNISIDIAVKKYKTVHEILGSSGKLGAKASVSRSEIIGLVESYSTEVTSPTFNYETASESVGLSESYSTLLKRQRGAVEVVGLKETLRAKRIQGNMETTYVLEDLTQWTEISRVTTSWIKTRIEIN